jgi:two-component system, chemotaxis family, CheB/CheR fusion protein
MIVYAQHNLIKDAPFTRLDLLSCRNLMIYLNVELQKKIIPIFHYSLNGKGLLFLGPAETIGGFTDMFPTQKQSGNCLNAKPGPQPYPECWTFLSIFQNKIRTS